MNKIRIAPALGLALMVLAGGYLRLARLEQATMGGDVMEYYKICQSGVRPAELLVHSPQYIGAMPPLWFAAHNWFLQTFHLPVNFGTVRRLDALTGLLAILAAFWAGRAAGGRGTGLLTAFLVTLQPLHVQMSRESYFYVPIVLGGFIGLWALLRLSERIAQEKAPGIGFYLLAFPAFLLLTHVQISSWSFAAVWIVALYALLLPAAIRRRLSWGHVAGLTFAFFLLGLPTLMSEWGMRDVLQLVFGQSKDHWANVFGDKKENLAVSGWRIASAYLAGNGGWRTAASLLLLAAGGGAVAHSWKNMRSMRVFAWFSGGAILLLAALHTKSIFPPEARHYSSLFPILAIWSSLGLVRLGEVAVSRWKQGPAWKNALPFWGAMVLIAGLNCWPAWLASHVVGFIPYRMVSEWADTHLPPGTVVLCDRWFTPWNEFRMNPSTNVIYTFTVPSEPIQVYGSSRWRETAKEFMAINPLAAYFEQKLYWTRIGPWTWPHGQFARKQEFVDKVALRLDAMGLFYRAWDPDLPREWVPITLFYNTEEDLRDRAHKAGQRLLYLFGPGWEYLKTQDYRDWYLLRDETVAILYNLTSAPLNASLDVTGLAVQGAVTAGIKGGQNVEFPAGQLLIRRLGPVQLAPGRNEIRLVNLAKPPAAAGLLVRRIAAVEN